MGLIVVTVADVSGSNKELKRVVLIQVKCPSFDLLLQMSHALFAVARTYSTKVR